MKEPTTRLHRRSFLASTLAVAGVEILSPPRPAAGQQKPEPAAPAPSDLDLASALDAARAIRQGAVSSVELTKQVLRRIEKYNPKLNAIVTLDKEGALARAKAADEAAARGDWWGPFHGVPCTVKDTFETKGVRTTAGAPFLAKHVPKRDALVVERLKGAGAVILGKTNTPLLAGDGQTFNEVFGTTNNPYNPERTPGGSSGGSAAALAAGLTFLCVGSDIAGSIRAPAHCCGLYGHKPSLNVIPTRGHIPPLPGGPPRPPSDLGVAGPLARSAADLKAALAVLGGPDKDEAVAYRWSLPPARGTRLTDYRIGFVLDDKICPVTTDVGDVLGEAVNVLRKAGTRLREGWPPGVRPAEQYDAWFFLFTAIFKSGQVRDEDEEPLRKRAARSDDSSQVKTARALTASPKRFLEASAARTAARALWQEFFKTHDAFLLPTVFCAAPPHDHTPQDARSIPTPGGKRPFDHIFPWISFATLAGLPATVAPVGQTKDGLPVGIQVIGPYLEDATPIDVAGHLSAVLGGYKPPQGF
jgi:amidase